MDFAYFRVVRSGCDQWLLLGASGRVLAEKVVKQGFGGAAPKRLVKEVAKSREFLKGKWCDSVG